MVTRIKRRSVAARVGIEPGMRIERIDAPRRRFARGPIAERSRVDLHDALIPTLGMLEALSHAWWRELGLPGRRCCTKDEPRTRERLVHLHCDADGSREISRHLAFREYLRERPGVTRAYEKARCQRLHPDGAHACSKATFGSASRRVSEARVRQVSRGDNLPDTGGRGLRCEACERRVGGCGICAVGLGPRDAVNCTHTLQPLGRLLTSSHLTRQLGVPRAPVAPRQERAARLIQMVLYVHHVRVADLDGNLEEPDGGRVQME
ncbi:hypothetical protein MYXA107069_23495 [Myxococcus xanthus]|nr:hypothetical protein MyxoNM_11850 [Myxococcus xanthus]SDY23635.1 GrpB protein [Myxococcus xanthus]